MKYKFVIVERLMLIETMGIIVFKQYKTKKTKSIMTNYLEKKLTQLMIKTLRKGYGLQCKEYDENCMECRAKMCVGFLEGHLSLLEWDRGRPWFYKLMKKYDGKKFE